MKNGFTLVETLVALFVFGLLAMMAVIVLGSSADAQLRLSAFSEEVQDVQRVRAALRADLAQAAERLPRGEVGEVDRAFSAGGDDGRLFAFVRRGWENPGAAPRASLQYVEYRLADGALVRQARPMVDGAKFGEPAVLARNIEAASASFRAGDDWREVWDPVASEALPAAVRLDLTTTRFGTVRQQFLTQVPA